MTAMSSSVFCSVKRIHESTPESMRTDNVQDILQVILSLEFHGVTDIRTEVGFELQEPLLSVKAVSPNYPNDLTF